MLLRFTLCSALALAPVLAGAQEGTQEGTNDNQQRTNDDQAVTNDQLLQQIQLLQEDLQAVKDLASRVKKTEEDIAGLRSEMNQSLDALTTRMNRNDEELRQIVESISTQDSSGQHVPDLLANMERSTEFKQNVRKAVHDSLNREGTFTIVNKTNSYQQISVNRTQYGVNSGATLTLQVPVGTVTTRLPGQPLENWTLSAPDYEEGIEIVPTSDLTTVYRPATDTYSSSTVTTTYYPSSTTTYYSPSTSTYYSPSTSTYYSPWTSTYYSPYYSSPAVYYYQYYDPFSYLLP